MNNKRNKRALVLSGGGSKGAYSVGVVKALLEDGRQYDVITGVSVGALIGASMAMFPVGQQQNCYEQLERVWTKEVTSNKSIYKKWAPWFLTYIWSLWKGGIYNMEPLRNILKKEVRLEKLRNSGVEFEVGVVSLQSGKYKAVNLSSDPSGNQLAVDWIWASSVFPVLFPAVEIGGEQWVDGGVRNVIPVEDVLKYKDITHIDAVITSPRNGYVPPGDIKKSTLDVGLRSVQILSDEVYATDFDTVCKNSNVKLEVFDPEGLVNDDSFEFNPEEIKNLIDQGYNETREKILKNK